MAKLYILIALGLYLPVFSLGFSHLRYLNHLFILFFLSLSPATYADDSVFSLSGFGTFAIGKVVGGTANATAGLGYNCPCFISDYAHNGVYEARSLSLKPDSKLGVQAQLATSDKTYSLTAQAVARGAANGNMNLEWLYATAELTSNLTLQVGRKRLPLFQFSDVQDVGHALPSIHLPPQMYGWENVNYNGINLRYRDQVASWFVNTNVLAGGETQRNSGYWKIYNGKHSKTAAKWNNILGVESKVSKDWFELRGVYLQSDTQNRIDGVDLQFSDPTKQKIYGLTATADFGQLFLTAEVAKVDRKQSFGLAYAELLSAGYRIGKFTPFVSVANYHEKITVLSELPEAHRAFSTVLRYDINSSSALKIQFDLWKDKSNPAYSGIHGDSKLLSLSFDKVF
jgi:hypothetical protein